MSILNNDKDYEYYLEKCTQANERNDFKGCLNAALDCFKLVDKSNDDLKKKAAVRMIKYSAEKLLEELQKETINDEMKPNSETCSFCRKSGEHMKFVCGVDVRICHECIDSAYGVIHEE